MRAAGRPLLPAPEWPRRRWPDRAVHSKQVTLANPGDTPATVDLAAHVAPIVSGPSTGVSAAADADPITVSPAQLTVPAGGSASFTATLDPAAALPAVR